MRYPSVLQAPLVVRLLFVLFIFIAVPGTVFGQGGPGEQCGASPSECDQGLVCINSQCLIDLIAPEGGATDVEVDAYFQWYEVSGAEKYVLEVDAFAQSEDNILPGKCSGGVCSYGFLELLVSTIDYASLYTWKVTAHEHGGDSIVTSESSTFTTEQEPVVLPGDGGGGGGDGDGDTPATFENPISAQNLTELFNNILNFLFGLAIFIVPVLIIYAAFLMLMGGGDAVKLAKGRMILLWTAIAFILILLSKGLPVVFKNIL
jgi:hypothetical protein